MQIRKFKTLKIQLFSNYSLLFVLMWGIFVAFVYIYFFTQIRQQVINQQFQVCSTTEQALQNKITVSDTLSLNILYSNLVRKSFTKQSSLYHQLKEGKDNTNALYLNAQECSALLSNIVGMTGQIAQVNLYDLERNIIGYGSYNGRLRDSLQTAPWIENTQFLNGRRYVSPPHKMEWISAANTVIEEPYISLTRAYKNLSFEHIGYVEIVQNCSYFFKDIDSMLMEDPNLFIFIFNANGECIYPYSSTETQTVHAYRTLFETRSTNPSACTVEANIDEIPHLISSSLTSEDHFTIFVSQPKSIIYDTLSGFHKFFFLLAATFLAMILLLSFALSNRITKPLRNLHSAISQVNLTSLSITRLSEPLTDRQNIIEISDVITAFNTMYDTLSRTINELLSAKSEELNSKFLAIQAQMNPHFLYNSLTNISVMAEENMNRQIISTCQDITFMLRYITVQNNTGVEFAQELDYTIRYLNCMKIRYENDLLVSINIPETLKSLTVPKMILQPLVENAVKYGFRAEPPWHIFIHGSIHGKGWCITVSDEGNGFSDNALSHLQSEIDTFNRTAQIPQLSPNGMGLLNIYIRLKLLYKDEAIFEIKNFPEKGASVTVGKAVTKTDVHNISYENSERRSY